MRLPHSHEQYVRVLLSDAYGLSGRPDGAALSTEVAELDRDQLVALRARFGATRAHVQAGLERLQADGLPQPTTSPSDMLHYLVHEGVQLLEGQLAHLAYMEGIVAREQQRRGS